MRASDVFPWIGLVVDFLSEFALEDDSSPDDYFPVAERALDFLGVSRGATRNELLEAEAQLKVGLLLSERDAGRKYQQAPAPILVPTEPGDWKLELLPPQGTSEVPVLRASVAVPEETERLFRLEWALRTVTGSLHYWERNAAGGREVHVVLSPEQWESLWALCGQGAPQDIPAGTQAHDLREALLDLDASLREQCRVGIAHADRERAKRLLGILRRPEVRSIIEREPATREPAKEKP